MNKFFENPIKPLNHLQCETGPDWRSEDPVRSSTGQRNALRILFQGVGTLVSHETQHFIWSTTMFLPINSFSNTILLQMSFGFYTKFSRFPGIFDPKRSHLDLGSLQSHSSSLRDRPQPTTSVHHAWNMMEGMVSTRRNNPCLVEMCKIP